METYFLSQNYIAVALLEAKNTFFRENFITWSELNRFNDFIQQEFNKQNLNGIITSDGLSKEDFDFMGEVIISSRNWCFNLDRLPINIIIILKDKRLIARFFLDLESEKLKTLENAQAITPKLVKK